MQETGDEFDFHREISSQICVVSRRANVNYVLVLESFHMRQLNP